MILCLKRLFPLLLFLSITCSSTLLFAGGTFIPAPGRVDMVHDGARGILYITSGTSVLRYNLATKSFLTPYTFATGSLSGIDLSPDGNTLAVADANITGIHLIDLTTNAIRPDILFTPGYYEGGSFTLAYGKDGSLLVTTKYKGSGQVPLRRLDPATGEVTVIRSSISQDTMVSASADGKCIALAESNSSAGPVDVYDVQSRQITKSTRTDWYNFEIAANRDCTQFSVPTYGGTFIYGEDLAKLRTVGEYAGAQPISAIYHPASDVVYTAWAGTEEIRAYDARTFAKLGSYNIGYAFGHTGNHAFNQGRLKLSRDASLLFVTVGNGISWIATAGNPVANDQSIITNSSESRSVTLTGNSPLGLPITYTVLTNPSHGTLSGAAPGLTYTPTSDYSGTDSFTFKTSDGTLDSSTATIFITIDKSAPVIDSFSMPATSATLNVPVSTLFATDNLGVSGYCLTQGADHSSCSWTAAPTSYRFSGTGRQLLYAFARDAAGNVSDPASVTVEISDIVPQITSFAIPSTYHYGNLTLPVTFTASDESGISGYCLGESADPAACNWTSFSPSSYTLASAGPHTLFAFVRSNLGRVSAPASAATTVVGKVNFIPAAGRVDLVHDSKRNVVYISAGTQVLRYDLNTHRFLPRYTFDVANLTGIDLSPDGNTLAVADRNVSGIHLVDLESDAVKPDVIFNPQQEGTHSVAYGGDGALLVSGKYPGSGWVPLRRVDPATGAVTVVKNSIRQDSMLSASADGKCIAYEESNITSGPVGIYDVAARAVIKATGTDWFTYEVAANRDCTQFSVPTGGGTFILDGALARTATVGVYAAGRPVAAAYHPLLDIVYFPWADSQEVRAYDTRSMTQLASFDMEHTFESRNGSTAYGDGRIKIARDGSLLLVTTEGGVRYQRLTGGAPTAEDQSVTAPAQGAIPITLLATSVKKKALTYTITTQPSHGTVEGTPPNLVYTPDAGYEGMDGVAFKVNDGEADSNIGIISIAINAVPTDGVCGSANGSMFTSAPVLGLCSVGTPSEVSGSGPWTWVCSGSDGGSDSACAGRIPIFNVSAVVYGGYGSISCTSPVKYGGSSTCTITPDAGFELDHFSDTGNDRKGSVLNGSYTISNITGSHSIYADFRDTAAPIIAGFAMPAASTSATVALDISASDNKEVIGYYLTTSTTAPSAGEPGWISAKPASYTFTGLTKGIARTETLFLYVKDAAAHVSLPGKAVTTITLPDTEAPMISAFTTPATSASATVAVGISASDNMGVTGYYLSTRSDRPLATAAGWRTAKPVSYTFTGLIQGVPAGKALYLFVKDAAGNVSLFKKAVTVVTLPDTTRPVIAAFTILASSTSATIPVSISASDNKGVTGYYLSTSSTPPVATAAGWLVTKPVRYTCTGIVQGVNVKALYAFVKDAAGNVSLPKKAVTVITLPDTTKPVISAFMLPANSTSATVALSIAASDNKGVTGYYLSTSSSVPLASAATWRATKPVSYTFTGVSAGVATARTVYIFVKDAAGNVSSGSSARTVITLK